MAYKIEETYDSQVTAELAGHYREILRLLGEDPDREGLISTPVRVAKAMQFLTKGYGDDAECIIGQALFENPLSDDSIIGGVHKKESARGLIAANLSDDSILGDEYKTVGNGLVHVRDISFSSMCEHHLMPFFGTVHVAYVPGNKIVGLSKIARVVECFSRRLQVQERLTSEICEAIQNAAPEFAPLGVAVAIDAMHTCMTLRGVQKTTSSTRTYAYTGVFLDSESLRRQFELE